MIPQGRSLVATLQTQPLRDKEVAQPPRNLILSRVTWGLKATGVELFGRQQHPRDAACELLELCSPEPPWNLVVQLSFKSVLHY